MKVVIATTYVPFTKGGGTMIIDSLADQLKKRKYEVDIVWIPLWWYWEDVPEQALALRLLDITESNGNKIDRVITVRYPSYAIQHPNKVAWFIHHHRGAYDLYGTYYQDLPNTPEGDKVRQMMFQYDTYYLREHRHIYTNSKIVAQRLKQFNQIDADAVLYPPLPNSEDFYAGEYGDYFLYTSRVTSIKRQALAVEAMRYVKSPFRLVIAGKGDTPEQMQMVEEIVERYGLQDRVVFTGWISDEEKIKLTANAYGCLYIPFDEDSYGYPTLEAFHSHKPVITCTDSGGTDEVIIHNENGMIVEPKPQALADAMEKLWSARTRIQQMGEAAYQTIHRHHIEWDHVISHLMRD
jgi:glycosyltransferase involved in cell wall biosynthesis